MSKVEPLRDFVFTEHALTEMARRKISRQQVTAALDMPEQVEAVRDGRVVYQARLEIGRPPNAYLLRIFVDIDRNPPQVVTAYLTSKIDKYWR